MSKSLKPTTRSAKIGCTIRRLEPEEAKQIEIPTAPTAPKRGEKARSSILRIVESREDLEETHRDGSDDEDDPHKLSEADMQALHGFKKRDKPFIYIKSVADRRPGELLREDKKKAEVAATRARRFKPDVVKDRLLQRLLA